MLLVLILLPILIFATFANNHGHEGLVIKLRRQKSPREIGMNMNNFQRSGLNFDWLKPHPHPHNHTNDSIALHRYLDSEFYGTILVGKPGKPFNVLFDTTWGDSWLMSVDCNYRKIGCWFHNKYDHDRSSTYVENGTDFSLNFGKYNLSGFFSADTFSIGHLRVDNQTFVEITDIPYYYMLSKGDGIMGMGFSKLGESTPFFYNLLKQNKLKKKLFSVYLNRDPSSTRGGNIILGAIQNKHIHVTNKTFDQFTYLPVITTNGYWQYQQDRVVVDTGIKSFAFCKNGCHAIADTSAYTIMGPTLDVQSINHHLRGTELIMGRYQVNCDTVLKLPHIHFILKGKNFTLTGKEYIQKVSYNSFTFCLSAFVPRHELVKTNMWIVGGAFLSQFYSVYDFENNQVGFVRAA